MLTSANTITTKIESGRMSLGAETELLSPQKEQEIASKILQRAELAQMTRQLKLGLSKVASPKKGPGESPVNHIVGKTLFNKKLAWQLRETIPSSVGATNDEEHTGDDRQGHAMIDRLAKAGELPDLRHRRSEDEDNDDCSLESPLKKQKGMVSSPVDDGRPATRRSSTKDISMPPVPTTPSRNSNCAFAEPGEHEDKPKNEEMGADLLMYLATSPYSSMKQSNIAGSPRAPLTPSYINHGSSVYDAVRLSHIKPNTSPQSTFKTSMHLMGSHIGAPTTTSSSVLSQGGLNDIIDSPSMSLYMSPSPRKRKNSAGYLLPSCAVPETTSLADIMHPPSSVQSITSHLLRTPNFNMNDYVRNLFSPSPRIETQGTSMGSMQDRRD